MEATLSSGKLEKRDFPCSAQSTAATLFATPGCLLGSASEDNLIALPFPDSAG